MMKNTRTRGVRNMAECQPCNEPHGHRGLYPALVLAAMAGVAVTYWVIKRNRDPETAFTVDRVVNLCNRAADKLDSYVSQSLAS